MGILSSKPYHKDPSAFATEVDPNSASASVEDDLAYVKSYDYVVIGGGKFIVPIFVVHCTD